MGRSVIEENNINGKYLLLQIGILAVCISLSIFNKQFTYLTFAIPALTCMFDKNRYMFCQLFFLLPFTVIFKTSPESSSFFAYLMLLFSLSIIARRKINLLVIIPVAIYLLFGLLNEPIMWIKYISGWILLAYFVNIVDEDMVKHVSLSLSTGLIISSLWGLVKFSIPQLAIYVNDTNGEYMLGERVERFSGLYYDPNYFAVIVAMALFMMLNLGASGKIYKRIAFPLATVLLYFGALSYSKMFMLAAVLVIVTQLNNVVRYSKYKTLTIIGLAVLLFLLLPKFGDSSFIANFSDRFKTRDFSSGRFELASLYLSYIFSNMDVLLVGKGLGAELYGTHGPHNTFIEALYFLGVTGSVIYAITIYKIFSQKKLINHRTPKNYVLLIIFCFMISTLGMLMMNDLMFYFMLVWYSVNIDYKGNYNYA